MPELAEPPVATSLPEAAVLVAHGSADPRAAVTTRTLARAVAAARPGWPVRTAYLEHSWPKPGAVLAALAAGGCPGAVVVPLLFTAAYHGRVDLPAVVAQSRADGLRLPVRLTDVLGPVAEAVPAPLVAGLRRRLHEASGGPGRYDAAVLAAAGTRDPAARATVDAVAARLGAVLGVPCLAGYASAATPTPGAAVAALRAAGARRVVVAAYFIATGRLYCAAVKDALTAGAGLVAQPLGDAPELVELILSRLETGSRQLTAGVRLAGWRAATPGGVPAAARG